MSYEKRPASYRDLLVWQKGIELAKTVYRLTSTFPAEEKYGLVSQLCRAAVSVPSNIAEGSGRHSPKEFVQHLRIAYGSLCELETQLLIVQRLALVTTEWDTLFKQIASVGRLLKALIASLLPHPKKP